MLSQKFNWILLNNGVQAGEWLICKGSVPLLFMMSSKSSSSMTTEGKHKISNMRLEGHCIQTCCVNPVSHTIRWEQPYQSHNNYDYPHSPLFDRPIWPSFGALRPNLCWCERGSTVPWFSSSRVRCRTWQGLWGLGWNTPLGGRSSGMPAVPYISDPETKVLPGLFTEGSATLFSKPSSFSVRSLSSSLLPQQYSMQDCWTGLRCELFEMSCRSIKHRSVSSNTAWHC